MSAYVGLALLVLGSLMILVPVLLLRYLLVRLRSLNSDRCGWRNHKMGGLGREGLRRKRRGTLKPKKSVDRYNDAPGASLGL